jgi:hypothetical protein
MDDLARVAQTVLDGPSLTTVVGPFDQDAFESDAA